ncbi:MAG: glycosyltransferase family 2 protein, partial [Microgenomates group bacterium]
ELSIIIISYNTKDITKNCLNSIFQSLKNSKLTYEVIVVDNASNDGSQTQISKLKSQNQNLNLKTIFNTRNIGFAKANNQGVKIARGKYLLLLNSDILVLNNAIEKLLNFYKQNEKMFNFLGGKLLNKDLTPQPSCGPMYSIPMVFAHLFLKGDYWGLTRYSPNKVKEVDWVSGACILTTKKIFQKLGGFDENIFMYMDEIDLLYRAKKKGFKVFFYPQAQFIHFGSASSAGRTYPILQVYRGLIYFYKKHHNDPVSLFILKFMLKLKAIMAILIGKLLNNKYLIKTYEEAFKLVQMA